MRYGAGASGILRVASDLAVSLSLSLFDGENEQFGSPGSSGVWADFLGVRFGTAGGVIRESVERFGRVGVRLFCLPEVSLVSSVFSGFGSVRLLLYDDVSFPWEQSVTSSVPSWSYYTWPLGGIRGDLLLST